jgi:hypothetical protein
VAKLYFWRKTKGGNTYQFWGKKELIAHIIQNGGKGWIEQWGRRGIQRIEDITIINKPVLEDKWHAGL